jgi:hypothetical protein
MLFYVFYYVLASVMIFQGVQQLGERSEPLGVVPQEVVQHDRFHSFWGWYLVSFGLAAGAVGLLSHAFAGAVPLLKVFLWEGLASVGLFGLVVIFGGRKIGFIGKPTANH